MTLLWLLPKGTVKNRAKYARALLSACNIPATSQRFVSIHQQDANLWKKKSQRVFEINPERQLQAIALMHRIIELAAPSVVVVNDIASAHLLFPVQFGTTQKLEKFRGSVFYKDQFPNVAFVIIDDMFKCYAPDFGAKTTPQQYAFIAAHDVQKAARFHMGTQRKFGGFNYSLITDPHDAMDFARYVVENAIAYATDVETSMAQITCTGFSVLFRDGSVQSVTFPILRGDDDNANYHPDLATEMEFWRAQKLILESGIPCAMQNGRYDLDYFVKFNIFPKNAFYDTQLMMHSINGTLPKSLAFNASLYCDNYYFWKEEIAGGDKKEKSYRMPKTHSGMLMYYKYCARDCYYTLQCLVRMLPVLAATPWMLRNFAITVQQQYGPAYEMSMRGFAVNHSRRKQMSQLLSMEAYAKTQRFQYVLDDDINPNSSQQVAPLFYDFLGVKPIGKKRTAGEKELRRATFRNTIAHTLFNYLNDAKKASKKLQMLNGMKLKYNRMLTTYNASGTWTGRYSSKAHNWWVGSNMQNVSKKLRPFLVADEGCVLVGIDYSQSDGYFVAYESQDEAYISVMSRNMNEGYDTHSHHVEMMFGSPYDKVIEGKNNYEPWVVDPVTGQRQIIKRVIHGTNYGMREDTMLTTVGVAPLMAAAEILGFKTAKQWADKQVKNIVTYLQGKYYSTYKTVAAWPDKLRFEAKANSNCIEAYGGRTHCALGNLAKDKTGALGRQLASFKGQGGTAGNINRTLHQIYFNSDLPQQGVQLVAQVHDEIIFQIPETQLHLIDYILTIMQEPITLNNRTFYVPAEAEIGYSWQVYVDYDRNKSNDEMLALLRQKEADYQLKLNKGRL